MAARLAREGLTLSPPADRATLIRRVTLDLIGLPPTPAEVEAFLHDVRQDAYERVVDRLLASPHYGERWARPWLDLCHYADSDGYLTDQLRPHAWRYRQWVVDALNRDLPFDQFTLRQLAGDLLPHATLDDQTGTGFLRQTLSNREGGADLEEYRVEQVADRVAMVGATWLGLTVGCARCHDHKYDPISQREYYALYAYFDSTEEVNVDAPLADEGELYRAALPDYRRKRAEILAPVRDLAAALQARWEERLREAADHPGRDATWDRQWEVLGLVWGGNQGEGQLEGCALVQTPPGERTPDEAARLQDYFLKHGALTDPEAFRRGALAEVSKKLEELRKALPKVSRVPVVRGGRRPRPTRIHVRGDFRTPGDPVQAGTPRCLPPPPPGAPRDRLTLARWLVAPENPLTARVVVNRAWQELFGRGLVATSEDFGVRGDRPTHPELLDWLAAVFSSPAISPATGRAAPSPPTDRSEEPRARARPPGSVDSSTTQLPCALGWSFKRLHRLLVTSAAYRQSSRLRPELARRDPQNRLLARQASLRLSAEGIRDATLAVSGLLNPRVGGPSVFPPQPESVVKEGYENHWPTSSGPDRYRRGLYTWQQRLSPYAQNVLFDAPDLSRICTRRTRSNSSLQALTLLNDGVYFEAARALGARLLREAPGAPGVRLEHAFRLCLGRPPRPAERERLLAYLGRHAALLNENPAAIEKWCAPGVPPDQRHEAAIWAGAGSVLLNLHEFITRD